MAVIHSLSPGFENQVSGVSSKKARTGLKPDTRNLMLREGFITPDNVQKKGLFF
jgi:hypothetical protein